MHSHAHTAVWSECNHTTTTALGQQPQTNDRLTVPVQSWVRWNSVLQSITLPLVTTKTNMAVHIESSGQ